MKRRPWILVLLAGLHCLAPVGNLILNAYWARTPFFEYVSIFLQPQNFSRQWPHIALPIIAGIAIYACKKWSFWIYLWSMIGLFTLSYFGYTQRIHQISLFPLILAYSFNILLVSYFLIPTVRNIYFDPRLRWWETLPRYVCEIEAQIKEQGENHTGRVANFSEGGLFFKPNYNPKDNAEISILFNYANQPYEFKGHVIHHGKHNTVGFGVKFELDPDSKDKASELAKVLDSEGKLVPMRTTSSEDTFMFWIKNVFKTGKGLLPESKKKS